MLIADRANNISFECHQLIFFYSNVAKTWCQVATFCIDGITVILYLRGGTSIWSLQRRKILHLYLVLAPTSNPKDQYQHISRDYFLLITISNLRTNQPLPLAYNWYLC